MISERLKVKQFGIYFFIIFLFYSISGCSLSPRKHPHQLPDGPPKCPPTSIHKIPDAIPKVEPLSKCGNRFKKGTTNVYVTKKRRYHVLSTSKGYKARGKASWYGTKFHGRKTSSGEPYNMYAMTAAHTTLPLPSYIKVTNLHNRKSVIVKVNDRGPFHSNRLLDVSYAAAAKLDILSKGTADVEIESIDPRDHGGRIPIPIHKINNRFQKTHLVKNDIKNGGGAINPNVATKPTVMTKTTITTTITTKGNESTKILSKTTATTVDKTNSAASDTIAAMRARNANVIKPASKKVTSNAIQRPSNAIQTPMLNNTKTISKNIAKMSTKTSPAHKASALYLELGSFSERSKAEDLARKVASVSKNKTQVARKGKANATDANKSLKYLVRIGPMKDDNEAIKLRKELAKAKLPTATMVKETR